MKARNKLAMDRLVQQQKTQRREELSRGHDHGLNKINIED